MTSHQKKRLKEFLGEQFDAVYDRKKTIADAIRDTEEYLNPPDPKPECRCLKTPHHWKDGDPLLVNDALCPCSCHTPKEECHNCSACPVDSPCHQWEDYDEEVSNIFRRYAERCKRCKLFRKAEPKDTPSECEHDFEALSPCKCSKCPETLGKFLLKDMRRMKAEIDAKFPEPKTNGEDTCSCERCSRCRRLLP